MGNKIIKLITSISIIVILGVSSIYALSIPDAIISFFSIKETEAANSTESVEETESKEVSSRFYDHVSNETAKYFDEDETNVYFLTEKIYKAIINCDLDSLLAYMDVRFPDESIDIVKDFINKGDNKAKIVNLLKSLDYEVIEMYKSNDKVYATINFYYPSITKIYKKIIVPMFLQNIGNLFTGNIDEKTIESVIDNSIKEINKGTIEKEKYTYEFTFRKVYGEWRLSDINNIMINIENFLQGYLV